MTPLWLAAAAALILQLAGPDASASRAGRVRLVTARQEAVIEVSIADTPEEWRAPAGTTGTLEADRGVLLLFPRESFHAFSTSAAAGRIDAILFDASGHAVWIYEDISGDRYRAAPVEAVAVLVTRAGFCATMGVAQGNLATASGFSFRPSDPGGSPPRSTAAAERALRGSVRANPGDSDVCMELARFYLGTGRADEAAAEFGRINAIAPSAEAYAGLGALAAARGQADLARRHLERAIDLDPGFLAAYGRLARLLEHTGTTEDAVAVFERAVERNPDLLGARLTLARIHLARNELERAEAVLVLAMGNPSTRPDAMRIMGDVLLRRGRSEDAAEAYMEYLAAYPSAPHAAELRAFILVHEVAVGQDRAAGEGKAR